MLSHVPRRSDDVQARMHEELSPPGTFVLQSNDTGRRLRPEGRRGLPDQAGRRLRRQGGLKTEPHAPIEARLKDVLDETQLAMLGAQLLVGL